MKWNFDAKNYKPDLNRMLNDEISSILLKHFPEQKDFNVSIRIDHLKPIDIHFMNPEVE